MKVMICFEVKEYKKSEKMYVRANLKQQTVASK